MKKIRWAFVITIVLLLMNRISHAYEKLTNGVVFEIAKQKATDAQRLKIEVCSENIFRSIAAPEKSFSSRPSLMVEKANWEPVSWSMKEKNGRRKICGSTQVFVHSHRRLRIFIAPDTATSCSLNAASLRKALPRWRCHSEMKLREHCYAVFAIVVHNVAPRTKFAAACALSTIHHSFVGRLFESFICTAVASAL